MRSLRLHFWQSPRKRRQQQRQQVHSQQDGWWRRRRWRKNNNKNKNNAQQEQQLCTFLQTEVPTEVLHQILLTAGPTTLQSLSRVNKEWNDRVNNDNALWKTACQLYGKWQEPTPQQHQQQQHEEVHCWKEYYMSNPVVPIDFATIQAACMAPKTQCVWLPAGTTHIVSKTICIQQRDITIQSIRRTTTTNDNDDDDTHHATILMSGENNKYNKGPMFTVAATSSSSSSSMSKLTLRGVSMQHCCSPTADIWRGNAAIHVMHKHGVVNLQNCSITSTSGRGVVITNGGHACITSCHITQCASAGIAVTGISSQLLLQHCRVTGNGTGNTAQLHQGHSGIVLVSCQNAVLLQNTISHNKGAGVTVLSEQQLLVRHVILQDNEWIGNFDVPIKISVNDTTVIRGGGPQVQVVRQE